MKWKSSDSKKRGLSLLKCLLGSCLVTGVLLLVLALLLYKVNVTEKVVSAAIIAIYVASTFLAGFLAGKTMKNRKFLWGLLMGISYFLILLFLSLAGNRLGGFDGRKFLTTLILCGAGGMLGGMFA